MPSRWKFFVTSRGKRLAALGLIVLLVSTLLYLKQNCLDDTGIPQSKWSHDSRDQRFVTLFPDRVTSPEQHHDKKQILLWTSFFTGVVWDADHNVFQDCPVSNCQVTTNRNLLTKSNAVLFNVRDLSDHITDPLPQTRTQDQVWVLHNTEPPHYIYLPLIKYAGVFNWTSWYRRDATVYSPYGQWRYLNSDEKAKVKKENHFQSKSKMAFWVSSNCYDKTNRIGVIKELQKHFSIDTYGKCGNLKCKKNCREIFSDYKFYFSFENGYCRDYLTEKFWRPIIRNQIPIVRGGADYKTLAPPGSYISADDFPDTQTLAEFIQRVAVNESLYNSYFTWKQKYKLVPNGWTRMNWCGLCERLHDNSQPHQVYSDLKGWVQQDTCTLPCHTL